MKLKDWADKQGISYLTAWRWFKAGDPRLSNAYQSESGTIIVPEEQASSELEMSSIQDSDIMSVILKKTVEFSKNQYAIEDFTAWILSNFTLKVKGISESPKYTKVKPRSEEVQKHFQQFLKPKGEKPKANMFVATDPEALDELMIKSDDLTAQELVAEIHNVGTVGGVSVNLDDAPEVEELYKDLASAISVPKNFSGTEVKTYCDITEGVVTRSVDLTPQQLNYTSSASPAFSNSYLSADSSDAPKGSVLLNDSRSHSSLYLSRNTAFKPTQKELDSATKVSAIVEKPRRGRKRSKLTGNE